MTKWHFKKKMQRITKFVSHKTVRKKPISGKKMNLKKCAKMRICAFWEENVQSEILFAGLVECIVPPPHLGPNPFPLGNFIGPLGDLWTKKASKACSRAGPEV